MIVNATVSYPVYVELEVSEGDILRVNNDDNEAIEFLQQKIKELADNAFHNMIKPVITQCDIEDLEE